MKKSVFNAGLRRFLDKSPTPFHAVANLRAALVEAGFEALDESQSWNLVPGAGYFVIRNDSSIVAFSLAEKTAADDGFRLVGAHTDSPCLKLKPNALLTRHGYLQLGVEVYGGVLLNPWFDRDLSLAGRVTARDADGSLRNCLVDFRDPVAVVPSLAIHLDRQVNESRSINKQTDIPPLVAIAGGKDESLQGLLLRQLEKDGNAGPGSKVLDFDLSLYDTQGAGYVGISKEFIASARLDNLLSCYTGLCALLDPEATCARLLVCNDHEEIGSGSTAGARGNFLESTLQRITGSSEDYGRVMSRSLLVSTDNAHGVHPNFADRHDGQHGPMLNAGPVLKVNSNQSYASNSETAALYRDLAERADVPVQSFVVRTDMGCGSTIGPLTATRLGVRTVDVGVPTFAMHSIRELAGTDDAFSLYRVLCELFRTRNLDVAAVSAGN